MDVHYVCYNVLLVQFNICYTMHEHVCSILMYKKKGIFLQVHFGDAIDFNTLNECVQFIPIKWHNSWT